MQLQRIILTVMSLLFCTGCAPSIRYTSSADGQIHYMVPRNWDYRKYYNVPDEKLLKIISGWIGTPYRWAGMSRRGVDCSGFVCLVYQELNGTSLPHSSRKMKGWGKSVSMSQAKAGDIVFFRGGLFHSINHVGIYIGNNRFAHASSSVGVRYSSLSEEYYKKRFADIRRLY